MNFIQYPWIHFRANETGKSDLYPQTFWYPINFPWKMLPCYHSTVDIDGQKAIFMAMFQVWHFILGGFPDLWFPPIFLKKMVDLQVTMVVSIIKMLQWLGWWHHDSSNAHPGGAGVNVLHVEHGPFSSMITYLVGGWAPTPLKNHGVRQLWES